MHLRVLTYNVQCRPLVDVIDNEVRAEEIARRIAASHLDYDIICLNEVFDEDARDKFVAGLETKYPHYIRSIGGDVGFAASFADTDKPGFIALSVGFQLLTLGLIDLFGESEDSGLMLFSRFPFDTKPNAEDPAGAPVPAVNWQPYSQRTGTDALSEKGALAIRLLLPDGGKYVVSATHMQASDNDDEENADIRLSQLDEAWINMKPLLSEDGREYDFIHCGDMNVNGAMTLPDAGDAGGEWKARFSQPMVSAADYWDAVAFEQSPHLWDAVGGGLIHPVDPGITVPTVNGDRRYDYFLTRPSGNGNRTLQHAFIDHPLCATVPKLSFTSDHWPVVADLMHDHRGSGTSAARGIQVLCDEATPSFGIGNGLRPGEIVWFCVLNAGTYEFATFGADITLYGEDNLSRPLAVYQTLNRGAERSVKYLLPGAPVFVKLQAADRYSAPAYALNIRRYLGTSLRDAIGLARRTTETSNHRVAAPNSGYECRLGDGETVADARYFEFDVLKTSSGKPQRVHVECASTVGGAPMRLILAQEFAPDALNVLGNTRYGTGAFSIDAELEAGHYFVVVQRQPGSGFAGSDFSLSWDSNVSVLYGPEAYYNARGDADVNPLAGLPPPDGIKLACIEETDSPFDLGSDDIAVELLADGVSIVVIPNSELGNFDTGDFRWLDPWISSPVTYVDRLQLKIAEEDTFVDDRSSIEFPVAAKYRGGGRPVNKRLKADVVVVTERTDFSGGTYALTVTLG
jgi:endonuclease/exonuclease/phosphatase family metal-dependent hydrolase